MKKKLEKILDKLPSKDRKIIEEEFRNIELTYKTLTDNLNVGIYRNTPGPEGKGKFIFANPTIVKMFGYSSLKEFLSINVSDLYQNPENRKKFNEKMKKYGEVKDEELLLKRKDGTPFVGSVTATAVKDSDGNILYYDGIITDISGKIKAEEILKRSLDRTEKLLQATVSALALAVEKRDPYTAGHQARAHGAHRRHPQTG